MPSRAVSMGHYAVECLLLASESMDQMFGTSLNIRYMSKLDEEVYYYEEHEGPYAGLVVLYAFDPSHPESQSAK